ncbi:polysaccharide deacetylase family protein [Flavobacterium luteum]|uniref:Polysaccharide deacetylase family protein n=1 Tax=Flavobacterium luteum TaxID=2026654 RepID=A0A7J5AB18_9FLAO|nr:polysaccharide deacetylase family protein [Flavobacterium luteum]KAB1154762.1 polysaccharide deacetylase family protein [Flavobacterium luteum]
MSKLPVLMYHNICINENESKGLHISVQKLENQLRHLAENRYTSFHLSELEHKVTIPKKSIVITFDDVTENQFHYAIPLLLKYNFKATFFIPFAFIGKTDIWNASSKSSPEKIMSLEQLKSLDSSIELGLHSYSHKEYDSLSDIEITKDFEKCFEIINKNNLKVYNAIAYPYGNFPKNGVKKESFFKVLKQNNIKMGLRIGNRVNQFPLKSIYEIMRLDIKGEDSLLKFKLKIRFGKLKLF